MENFGMDQRYSTQFDDLAYFTRQYRRLMTHWHDHLPVPILTVPDLESAFSDLTAA